MQEPFYNSKPSSRPHTLFFPAQKVAERDAGGNANEHSLCVRASALTGCVLAAVDEVDVGDVGLDKESRKRAQKLHIPKSSEASGRGAGALFGRR